MNTPQPLTNLPSAGTTGALTTGPFAPYARGDFAGLPFQLENIGPPWKHVGWGTLFHQMPRVPMQFVKLSDILDSQGSDVRVNVLGYAVSTNAAQAGDYGMAWVLNLIDLPVAGKLAPEIELSVRAPSTSSATYEITFPGLPRGEMHLVAVLNVILRNSSHGRYLEGDEETSIFRYQHGCDCGHS